MLNDLCLLAALNAKFSEVISPIEYEFHHLRHSDTDFTKIIPEEFVEVNKKALKLVVGNAHDPVIFIRQRYIRHWLSDRVKYASSVTLRPSARLG